MSSFEEANNKVHLVEDQWHYSIMTRYGFESTTTTQQGFVRAYKYVHKTLELTITCNTGASADYWRDEVSKEGGYWGTLEDYLMKVTKLAE